MKKKKKKNIVINIIAGRPTLNDTMNHRPGYTGSENDKENY